MLSGGGDSSTSLWRLKSRNVAKVPISIEGRKTLADAEMTVELERFAEVQKESVGYLGV
jgi:7-cyano-7-deazaguanine synthase in queuosine biosynthesis